MVIPEEQPTQPALPIQPEGMRVVCGHCGNTFLVGQRISPAAPTSARLLVFQGGSAALLHPPLPSRMSGVRFFARLIKNETSLQCCCSLGPDNSHRNRTPRPAPPRPAHFSAPCDDVFASVHRHGAA